MGFTNATFNRLPVDHVGPVQKEDINPVNRLIILAPDIADLSFGGEPKYETRLLDVAALTSKVVFAGSPRAHIQFFTPDLSLNFSGAPRGGARGRQEAEPVDDHQRHAGMRAAARTSKPRSPTPRPGIPIRPAPAPAGPRSTRARTARS